MGLGPVQVTLKQGTETSWQSSLQKQDTAESSQTLDIVP